MIYLKINQVRSIDGQYDYKGLNLKSIVPGTQHYSHDVEKYNYCILCTTETVGELGSNDVEQITKEQYMQCEKELASTRSDDDSNDDIATLKAENADLKMAMAELAEQQMLADAETKLAMAELAEAMMGGVK